MELKTILILAGVILVIVLVGVHSFRKSAFYRKAKSTGADIGDTISATLGWVASPYLWLGVFWAIYNPWGYSYYEYMKNYNFGEGNSFDIILVATGAFLTIVSLFFITKAWKKLGFFGHTVFIVFISVYVYSLYKKTDGFVDEINYGLHFLIFLTVYGAWGMIYPKLSKKTHAEVGVNINTDDVEDMADH